MKNVHLLPTDKPSRLFLKETTLLLNNQYTLQEVFPKGKCQNIYITSDEEIKEGDWILDNILANKKPIKVTKELLEDGFLKEDKRIILTTDQDLIKNGVQAIDDEFLEWFVKNPSCEEVETFIFGFDDSIISHFKKYEIIIPKEEPKQSVEEYEQQGLEKYSYELDELGKASEHYFKSKELLGYTYEVRDGFIDGAKWMQKRMYSEQTVFLILSSLRHDMIYGTVPDLRKWFKDFKKK
jgi:hypothetical protein